MTVEAGQARALAILAGEHEPLVVAPVADIDRRIEVSCKAWREWTRGWDTPGGYREQVERSALALKVLLYSAPAPSRQPRPRRCPRVSAARRIYDYRYAWVRDAGTSSRHSAARGPRRGQRRADWLFRHLEEHGAQVLYTLNGEPVSDEEETGPSRVPRLRPVTDGKCGFRAAPARHIYGDIFETAARFVADGGMLDLRSGALLARLADECAERWKMKDAASGNSPSSSTTPGSKISCWQALGRAVEMADDGHRRATAGTAGRAPATAWQTGSDEHCWSDGGKTT